MPVAPRRSRFNFTIAAGPQTALIAVTAVNDAPTFVKGPNQSVLEDSGQRVVAGWASSFSPGPANESGQSLLAYHIVSNTNPSLFSAGPAIAATGGAQLFG